MRHFVQQLHLSNFLPFNTLTKNRHLFERGDDFWRSDAGVAKWRLTDYIFISTYVVIFYN